MIDRDSTTEFLMQFDGTAVCAGGSSLITGGQTKFSDSNKKFGSGSYFSDGQLTGLGSPNPAFYQQRTPKTGYRRIEETNANFTYNGSWTVTSGSSNTYSGLTAKLVSNTNTSTYVAFNFTGTKLMIIGLPSLNSPAAVYIRIDDKIYVINTRFSSSYCTCIFDITDLEDKEHMAVISAGTESTLYSLYFDAIDIDINADIYPFRATPESSSYYDRITFESPNALNFGINNFTISFWEYVVSAPFWKGRLRLNAPSDGTMYALHFGHTHNNGNMLLYMASDGSTTWNIANAVSLGATSFNQWVHWAITRQGSTFRVFKNGVQVTTFTSTLPLASRGTSYLGLYEWAYSGQYYMDELYVNNGTCLYSANFTPPTAPYEINWGPPKDFDGITLPDLGLSERLKSSSEGILADELSVGTTAPTVKIGLDLTTEPGARSRNHNSVELLIDAGNKSRIHDGWEFDLITPGSRLPAFLSGFDIPIPGFGYKSRILTGINLDDQVPSIRIPANFDGIPIEINPTSNGEFKYKLTVTPTHLHKLPTINILSEWNAEAIQYGRYELTIEDQVIVPFSIDDEDIRRVEINVSPGSLTIGLNKCRLSYQDPIGNKEYVDFELVKEEPKRTNVERLFRPYDGGYDGEKLIIFPNVNSKSPYFSVPDYSTSTLIKTTNYTSINLAKYTELQSVSIDAEGAKILVSFNKGITWKSFISGSWVTVDIANIAISGMSPSTVNSITLAQWSGVFTPTSIDFAVYLDNSLSDSFVEVSKQSAIWSGTANSTVGSAPVTATANYYIPSGYGITRLDWSAYGGYNNDGGSPQGYGIIYTYNRSNNLVLVAQVLTFGGTTMSGSVPYEAFDPNRPIGVYLWAYRNSSKFYGWASATVYAAPAISYLKSIDVQITPNLKTGYAFII